MSVFNWFSRKLQGVFSAGHERFVRLFDGWEISQALVPLVLLSVATLCLRWVMHLLPYGITASHVLISGPICLVQGMSTPSAIVHAYFCCLRVTRSIYQYVSVVPFGIILVLEVFIAAYFNLTRIRMRRIFGRRLRKLLFVYVCLGYFFCVWGSNRIVESLNTRKLPALKSLLRAKQGLDGMASLMGLFGLDLIVGTSHSLAVFTPSKLGSMRNDLWLKKDWARLKEEGSSCTRKDMCAFGYTCSNATCVHAPDVVHPILREVTDQGLCGSCWAHALVHTVEDLTSLRLRQQIPPLSIIDLMEYSWFGGCAGESFPTALSYVQDNGILYQRYEPFTTFRAPHVASKLFQIRRGQNELKILHQNPLLDASARVDRNIEVMMQTLRTGPFAVGFQVSKEFKAFFRSKKNKGEVFVGNGTKQCGKIVGGHAVEVVGYGTQNGIPFWLAKNSWGKDWGDSGFFRIVRGRNMCKFESFGSVGNSFRRSFVASNVKSNQLATSKSIIKQRLALPRSDTPLDATPWIELLKHAFSLDANARLMEMDALVVAGVKLYAIFQTIEQNQPVVVHGEVWIPPTDMPEHRSFEGTPFVVLDKHTLRSPPWFSLAKLFTFVVQAFLVAITTFGIWVATQRYDAIYDRLHGRQRRPSTGRNSRPRERVRNVE